MTMTLIEHKELASAAASITFTNIPQTYTDLMLVVSARTTQTLANGGFQVAVFFNGVSTNLSSRILFGNGSSAGSFDSTNPFLYQNASDNTANSFGNGCVYIPNYAGSSAKSFSIDSVYEENGTTARQNLTAGLWNQTTAISSITLNSLQGGNLAQYSSVTLYGILKGSDGTTTVS